MSCNEDVMGKFLEKLMRPPGVKLLLSGEHFGLRQFKLRGRDNVSAVVGLQVIADNPIRFGQATSRLCVRASR